MDSQVSIKRTGRVFSIASSEFSVVYPDGSSGVVWSPPWHEMTPEEEESSARDYATNLYENGRHTSKGDA